MFGRCRQKIPYLPLATVKGGIQNNVEGQQWKWSSIVVKFWLMSLFLGGCLFFLDVFEVKSISFRTLDAFNSLHELPVLPDSLNGYVINTPGCRIPDIDPFDSSVKQYIYKPQKLICNNKIPPLFQSNLTSIFPTISSYPLYNITNSTQLNCCYEEFRRLEPSDSAADNQVTFSGECIHINVSTVHIKGEFVKLVCRNESDALVYEDYFPFVPVKKRPPIPDTEKLKPNILIVGIDAVSRLNLHRQLPNTFKYLTKELEAIELLGYNKVADNTFPNLIPVFTGMSESELEKSCYPSSKQHFDNCTFTWNDYRKRNYVTAVGEDCAWIGVFNYQKRGFKKQTSDYYYTTFSRVIENEIGNVKEGNCIQCVGGRETYKVLLDYIKKFALRMNLEAAPYFGFFWGNSLSHDYLNRPFLGDESYHSLFRELKDTGSLNNTVLVFMSDHGIRWGDIRQTYQGQMEERLPFVLMVLPEWFKINYPEAVANLKQNVRRLTTPFDLHETFKALLDVDNLKNATTFFNGSISRGFSLFDAIPKNRSCQDAEIVSHWCTCQQSIAINVNDTEVISAADFAINRINKQLEGYAQCATLAIDRIINARVLSHDSEHITNKKSIADYTINIQTTPGNAIFEVTVRLKENELQNQQKDAPTTPDLWNKFNITGTISRLNLYGKQSYCITDYHLKLYCYCKSLL